MPMLVLTGARASGKTYLADVLARLFARGRRHNLFLPASPNGLENAVRGEAVVIFDNVRQIAEPVSDELCRLLTGGARATEDPRFVGYGHLPMSRVIMTAIGNPLITEDLASRSVLVEMAGDAAGQQSSALDLDDHVEAIGLALAAVLAAFGKAQSHGSQASPPSQQPLVAGQNSDSAVEISRYRFQPFIRRILAVERKLSNTDSMAAALVENVKLIDRTTAAQEPLVLLIEGLLPNRGDELFTEATELMRLLTTAAAGRYGSPSWLKSPRSLSVALKHLQGTLGASGIEYTKSGPRSHWLRKVDDLTL